MNHQKCPACKEGLTTSSNTPNLKNHIKRHAAYELLKKFLGSEDTPTPHADYIKSHMKIVKREDIDIIL